MNCVLSRAFGFTLATALSLGLTPSSWAENTSPISTQSLLPGLPGDAVPPTQRDEFYNSLELEARKFYDVHKEQMPNLKRRTWDKLVRHSVFRMKQLGLNVKSLVRYARPAAGTFVITNIVSTFILPPVLTAAGFPGLAMLVLATPFEPFVAASQVYVMRQMDDMRLLKQIGMADFVAVKQLRRDLLGMPERAHILSVVESDLLDEIKKAGGPSWLNISSESKAGHRHTETIKEFDGADGGKWEYPSVDRLDYNTVTLKELEDVVRLDPEGEKWLDNLTPHRMSKQLYALEQWFYIQERPELRTQLSERLKGRKEIASLSKDLHELIDLRRSLRESEEFLKDTLKNSQINLSTAEKKAIKKLSGDISDQVNEVIKSVDLAETHLLLSQVSKTPDLVGDLSSAKRLLRERIKTYHTVTQEASRLSEDRLVTADSLRKQINSRAQAPDLSPGCLELFRAI